MASNEEEADHDNQTELEHIPSPKEVFYIMAFSQFPSLDVCSIIITSELKSHRN